MSLAVHHRPAVELVDGLKYWSVLLAIAAGHGLAILLAAHVAGLTIVAIVAATPRFIVAEMLLVALLLWPAVWLAIRRLHDRQSPGWLALPAILLAALALMTTAFGRPFAVPVDWALLHLLPLSLIVFVSACLIVEWLGIGRRSGGEIAPA